MDQLRATEKLFAEVTALRVAFKRLNAQFAMATGQFESYMAQEHQNALTDLANFTIFDEDPQRAEAIRMHAERVIDEIYTSMLRRAP